MSRDVGGVIASLVNHTYDVEFLKRLYRDESFRLYMRLKRKILDCVLSDHPYHHHHIRLIDIELRYETASELCKINNGDTLIQDPRVVVNNGIIVKFYTEMTANVVKKLIEDLDLKLCLNFAGANLSWTHWLNN